MTKNWLLEQSDPSSESDRLYTEFIVSKTELLEKHIEALVLRLEEASSMEQDLVQLLEALSNIIKKKNQEVT